MVLKGDLSSGTSFTSAGQNIVELDFQAKPNENISDPKDGLYQLTYTGLLEKWSTYRSTWCLKKNGTKNTQLS